MCGIAGIWHAGDTSILSLMLDRLAHRGPDAKGIYENHESNLFLGHRRLRIIDLSPQADQPMTSSDGRFVITYNGEVYNFREIRKKLEKLGLRFKTKSDTEVVLNALITWGTDCLKEFEGMFAFALWDNEKRKLILVRDRFGVKPLYFWQKGNSLIFASELKAILEHPTINRELNLSALADFLELGYIPEPKSIIKGIHKVPAGSILEFSENDAEPKIKRFFSPQNFFGEKRHEKDSLLTDELLEILERAFTRRIIADVPIGVFLSGGIDSSLLAAILARKVDKLRTFTIGFPVKKFDESRFARKVADIIGADHTELTCTPDDVKKCLLEIPHVYDEPFGDQSAVPTMLVSKLASQSVKVALSAEGGDEFFAGYTRYSLAMRWLSTPTALKLLATKVPTGIRSAALKVLGIKDPGTKSLRLNWLSNAHSKKELYIAAVRYFAPHEVKMLTGVEPAHNDWTLSEIDDSHHPLDFLRLADIVMYLRDDILVKTDRATMAYSLEGREPFLDGELLNFAASLPHEMLIKNGQGKYILRKLLARFLPKEITQRPKHGFGMPLGVWFRKELSEIANSTLSESRIKKLNFLDYKELRKIIDSKPKNALNTNRLWLVTMLVLWAEKWL